MGGVVDDTASRGAKGADAEFDLVIDYLSTHFGPTAAAKVNVNAATAKNLVAGLEISTQEAEAIVRYRADKGAFKSIQELTRVPGVDSKKIESVRDRIEF
jgi:competence protein ComEA